MADSADLITRFRDITRDPNGRIFNDTQVLDLANLAQLHFQADGAYKWPENEGVSTSVVFSGVREYSLPANFGQFELLQLGSEVLEPDEEIEFNRAIRINPEGTTTNNLPSAFYIKGNNIGFDFLPNSGTATLFYKKRVSDITDGATLDFGDDKLDAIAYLAAYFGYSRLSGERTRTKALEYRDVYKNDILPVLMRLEITRNPRGLSLISHRKGRREYRPLALNRYY